MTFFKTHIRKLVFGAICLASGFIAFSIVSSGTTHPIELLGVNITSEDGMVINGVHLVEMRKNRKELEIKAEKAVVSSDDSRTALSNFAMVSTGDESNPLTIVARKGALDNVTKDMSAQGDVLVYDDKDRALITQTLDWKSEKDEIRTDKPVWMFGKNFLIRGRGMIVDMPGERMRLLNEVRAIFQEAG